jgi:predicted deacylase
VPSTHIRRSPDPDRFARASALMEAFNAPYAWVFEGARETRALNAAAERCGIIALGTELCGGGTVTPAALRIAERGLRRALAHLGTTMPDPADSDLLPSRRLQVGGYPFYVYAEDDGVFEPLVALEDTVGAGQLAALIHPVETPWRAPHEAHFKQAGIVVCARVPGRVERGDCLFHLAIP